MALNTVFGWAILGRYLSQCTQQTVNVISPEGANPSDDFLTRFWESFSDYKIIIMKKSQETTVFGGRYKLTSAVKQRSEK